MKTSFHDKDGVFCIAWRGSYNSETKGKHKQGFKSLKKQKHFLL